MVAVIVAGCGTGTDYKRLGDPQVLEVGGQNLTVTPTQIIDPLQGIGVRPEKGFRAVGVKITFINHGSKAVTFQPGALVQLLAAWRPMSPAEVGGGPCATGFTFDDLQINPGQTAEGCLVYDSPTEVHVTKLRMHSDTRKASVTWKLGD